MAMPNEGTRRRGGGDGYDLVIVGSGSAAFAAAIRARDLGARVAMVERSTVGGTCVNVGCVPSKTLLRAGEVRRRAELHPFDGIETRAGAVDLRALVAQKDELVAMLRAQKYEDLIEYYGIDLIRGSARFTEAGGVDVDGEVLQGSAYLISTGAAPAVPAVPGLTEAGYLTSASALDITAVPGSLAVFGAGAIGLELGQFFLEMGADVTLLDILDRVAPYEEPEISEAMATILREQGAEIHAAARIVRVERDGHRRMVVAVVGGEEITLTVDEILIATGRRADTAHIGAEAAGIELDERGAVVVDAYLRTSNPHVYAAGDVTSAPQYVYLAAQQGALAAENALTGVDARMDMTALPRVTFTTPQIAAAGLGEHAAIAAGHQVKTSVLPLSAVPRALVNRDTRGLVKIVADTDTDNVLGVHVLADGAGEVIQAAVYAIAFGLTTADLARTWSPYLTMAEGLKLAAQTFSRDVAKLSCCAA
ncbi:mercury(II) reductase [Phytoactinopolyspora halotolerans]|uniref:Mercuric reductase n=1 Tax=Phytoactinopolyspora halotolerans TaxID=1981512 RepID=A0A6L9SGN0_9ACTN|nr:mercury(II) reductase [Phytoactinopolyspora halotolerans]NEE04535.1 mercury(II) reductase [Phytoactinopolyspora halotolerans]